MTAATKEAASAATAVFRAAALGAESFGAKRGNRRATGVANAGAETIAKRVKNLTCLTIRAAQATIGAALVQPARVAAKIARLPAMKAAP